MPFIVHSPSHTRWLISWDSAEAEISYHPTSPLGPACLVTSLDLSPPPIRTVSLAGAPCPCPSSLAASLHTSLPPQVCPSSGSKHIDVCACVVCVCVCVAGVGSGDMP